MMDCVERHLVSKTKNDDGPGVGRSKSEGLPVTLHGPNGSDECVECEVRSVHDNDECPDSSVLQKFSSGTDQSPCLPAGNKLAHHSEGSMDDADEVSGKIDDTQIRNFSDGSDVDLIQQRNGRMDSSGANTSSNLPSVKKTILESTVQTDSLCFTQIEPENAQAKTTHELNQSNKLNSQPTETPALDNCDTLVTNGIAASCSCSNGPSSGVPLEDDDIVFNTSAFDILGAIRPEDLASKGRSNTTMELSEANSLKWDCDVEFTENTLHDFSAINGHSSSPVACSSDSAQTRCYSDISDSNDQTDDEMLPVGSKDSEKLLLRQNSKPCTEPVSLSPMTVNMVAADEQIDGQGSTSNVPGVMNDRTHANGHDCNEDGGLFFQKKPNDYGTHHKQARNNLLVHNAVSHETHDIAQQTVTAERTEHSSLTSSRSELLDNSNGLYNSDMNSEPCNHIWGIRKIRRRGPNKYGNKTIIDVVSMLLKNLGEVDCDSEQQSEPEIDAGYSGSQTAENVDQEFQNAAIPGACDDDLCPPLDEAPPLLSITEFNDTEPPSIGKKTADASLGYDSDDADVAMPVIEDMRPLIPKEGQTENEMYENYEDESDGTQTARQRRKPVKPVKRDVAAKDVLIIDKTHSLSLTCDQCTFTGGSEQALHQHVKGWHRETVRGEQMAEFPCPSCPVKSVNAETLLEHLAHHPGQHLVRYCRCSHCGTDAVDIGTMEDHVSSSHTTDTVLRFEVVQQRVTYLDKLVDCPVCGSAFRWKQNFVEHLRNFHCIEGLANYLEHTRTFPDKLRINKTDVVEQSSYNWPQNCQNRPGTDDKDVTDNTARYRSLCESTNAVTVHICCRCTFSTDDINSYLEHYKSHFSRPRPTAVRPAKASVVNSYAESGPRADEAVLQQREEKVGGKYACHLCPFKTPKRMFYYRHMAIHERNSGMTDGYRCGYCQFAHPRVHCITFHLGRYHGNRPTKVIRISGGVESEVMDDNPVDVDEDRTPTPSAVKPLRYARSETEIRQMSGYEPPRNSSSLASKHAAPASQKDLVLLSTADRDRMRRLNEFERRLPPSMVYHEPVKCPLCSFTNVIRINLIRHIRTHRKEHQEDNSARSAADNSSRESFAAESQDNGSSDGERSKDTALEVNGTLASPSKPRTAQPLIKDHMATSAKQLDEAEIVSRTSSAEGQWTRFKGLTEDEYSEFCEKLPRSQLYRCRGCTTFVHRFPSKVRRHFYYQHSVVPPFRCGHCSFRAVERGKVVKHCRHAHPSLKLAVLTGDDDLGTTESTSAPKNDQILYQSLEDETTSYDAFSGQRNARNTSAHIRFSTPNSKQTEKSAGKVTAEKNKLSGRKMSMHNSYRPTRTDETSDSDNSDDYESSVGAEETSETSSVHRGRKDDLRFDSQNAEYRHNGDSVIAVEAEDDQTPDHIPCETIFAIHRTNYRPPWLSKTPSDGGEDLSPCRSTANVPTLAVQVKTEPIDECEYQAAAGAPTTPDGSSVRRPEPSEPASTPVQPPASSHQRQFYCVYCGLTSKWNKRDIRLHVMHVHVGVRAFSCNVCGFGHSRNRAIVTSHCSKSHPGRSVHVVDNEPVFDAIDTVQDQNNVAAIGFKAASGTPIHSAEELDRHLRSVGIGFRAPSTVRKTTTPKIQFATPQSHFHHQTPAKDSSTRFQPAEVRQEEFRKHYPDSVADACSAPMKSSDEHLKQNHEQPNSVVQRDMVAASERNTEMISVTSPSVTSHDAVIHAQEEPVSNVRTIISRSRFTEQLERSFAETVHDDKDVQPASNSESSESVSTKFTNEPVNTQVGHIDTGNLLDSSAEPCPKDVPISDANSRQRTNSVAELVDGIDGTTGEDNNLKITDVKTIPNDECLAAPAVQESLKGPHEEYTKPLVNSQILSSVAETLDLDEASSDSDTNPATPALPEQLTCLPDSEPNDVDIAKPNISHQLESAHSVEVSNAVFKITDVKTIQNDSPLAPAGTESMESTHEERTKLPINSDIPKTDVVTAGDVCGAENDPAPDPHSTSSFTEVSSTDTVHSVKPNDAISLPCNDGFSLTQSETSPEHVETNTQQLKNSAVELPAETLSRSTEATSEIPEDKSLGDAGRDEQQRTNVNTSTTSSAPQGPHSTQGKDQDNDDGGSSSSDERSTWMCDDCSFVASSESLLVAHRRSRQQYLCVYCAEFQHSSIVHIRHHCLSRHPGKPISYKHTVLPCPRTPSTPATVVSPTALPKRVETPTVTPPVIQAVTQSKKNTEAQPDNFVVEENYCVDMEESREESDNSQDDDDSDEYQPIPKKKSRLIGRRMSSVSTSSKDVAAGSGTIVCSVCEYSTPNSTVMRHHVMSHLQYYPYFCPHCKSFRSVRSFPIIKHIRIKHKGKTERFECDPDPEMEKKVRNTFHRVKSKQKEAKTTPTKVFEPEPLPPMVVEAKNTAKPWARENTILATAATNYPGQGNKGRRVLYKCKFCGLKTHLRGDFRHHIMRELQYKPYMCAFCEYAEPCQWSLRKHFRLRHPGSALEFRENRDVERDAEVEAMVEQCVIQLQLVGSEQAAEADTSTWRPPGALAQRGMRKRAGAVNDLTSPTSSSALVQQTEHETFQQ